MTLTTGCLRFLYSPLLVTIKRFTVLNFWATWCAPCIEEMPMLSEFYNKTKMEGVSVIGIAIDNEKNVKQFLQKIKVDHHLFVAGANGTTIMENISLENCIQWKWQRAPFQSQQRHMSMGRCPPSFIPSSPKVEAAFTQCLYL